MNCEASYIPFSLCFFPWSAGLFTNPNPPLLPLVVIILEPCISPHWPLHLDTIEHSSLTISEAFGTLCGKYLPDFMRIHSQLNNMSVSRWTLCLQPEYANMHLRTCLQMHLNIHAQSFTHSAKPQYSPTHAFPFSIPTKVPFFRSSECLSALIEMPSFWRTIVLAGRVLVVHLMEQNKSLNWSR